VGSKLTGAGEVGPGQFGFSLALSSAGTVAVIGAPNDRGSYTAPGGLGAAWVFIAAPELSHVRLTHTRFRVAPQGTSSMAGRTPLGTSFQYTLSAPATLHIWITRSAPGVKRGSHCVTPTARLANQQTRHCTRIITVARLIHAHERRGTDHLKFSGGIGQRALAPGTYRAALSATDASGRSPAVTLHFTILR
jgi:hypothetical protein